MIIPWFLQEEVKSDIKKSNLWWGLPTSITYLHEFAIKSPWTEETPLIASILWHKVSSHKFSRRPNKTGSFWRISFPQDMRKDRIFVKGEIQEQENIFIIWQPQ